MRQVIRLGGKDRFGKEFDFEMYRPTVSELLMLENAKSDGVMLSDLAGLILSVDGRPVGEAPADILQKAFQAMVKFVGGAEPLPGSETGMHSPSDMVQD